MMSFAAALGIGSMPPSEELINKHRKQRQLREEWQTKLSSIRNILQTLRDSYDASRGTCCCCRYQAVKNMIKQAVRQFEEFVEHDRAVAIGLAKPNNQGPSRGYGAMDWAASARALCLDAKAYSEREAGEVEEEMEQLRHEVIQLKHEYRQEKEKLERLATVNEDSKMYCPPQRYNLLKAVVTQVTMAYN